MTTNIKSPLLLADTTDTSATTTVTNTTPVNNRYPPVALTGNSTAVTGQTYGNGTYIISSSSFLGAAWEDWRAFDRVLGDNGWHSNSGNGANQYTASTGYYIGTSVTTVNGTAYKGEWIQLQLPTSLAIQRFTFDPRYGFVTNRMPRYFILAGSNDGTTWYAVYTVTGFVYANTNATQTFNVNSNAACRYYRLIVLEVGNVTSGGSIQDSVNLGEWALYSNEFASIPSWSIDVIGWCNFGKISHGPRWDSRPKYEHVPKQSDQRKYGDRSA